MQGPSGNTRHNGYTVMTILPPPPWPSTRYRMACGTWLSRKVLSMTAVTLPASMRSRKTWRSCCRGCELSIRSRWPTNRDSATALRLRSKPRCRG
jgi:hypothetical protein